MGWRIVFICGPFVDSGKAELGGELPCNIAGGLLSEGHTMGMGHVVKGVRQLSGGVWRETGKRC
ncbi:MAG: hypothetical protein JSW38_05310 [Dehalococcoidia bacterium]|nr:MAG: hypothetical protein JSV02_04465 [Dehalococcoidia bacterium]UCG84232.1 MAG: hypothetical protein JSW38_05310 [Dehalococcoidia bacterium]